ncbi:MAG: SMC-Scp complex subunit ScpB, partial [Pseudomonadota bacterium]
MTPLETAMTDDSNTDDIRQAVRQLSFVYQRSAKEHRDAVEDVMADALRRAEAVLFAAGEPLSAAQIAETLPQGVEPAKVLMELKRTYAGRGVQLIEVAGKWRFQTAPDLAFLFVEERIQQKKLSQAALETLAIIAYGELVTRAEIEA